MSTHNHDLLATVLLTLLALGTTLIPLPGILGWSFLALPLALILPGYALTAAWFPRGSLGIAETLACSIGLSLAGDVVGGVILNLTADGLTQGSWLVFLVVVTLGGCGAAWYRRRKEPYSALAPFSMRMDIRSILWFAASLAVVGYAITMVRNETLQPSTTFTELWAKPSAVLGQTAFNIGVHNSEASRMEYQVEVKAGDTLFESLPVTLAAGETWEKVVVFQGRVTGEVQVSLYRSDHPGVVYRQVVSRGGSK